MDSGFKALLALKEDECRKMLDFTCLRRWSRLLQSEEEELA